MKLEETPSGKFRCWLNGEEEELLANYYQEDIEKEIAIILMLKGGLRSDEVLRVSARDLERSEAGFWWLKITKSKTSYRETIIPESLASKIRTMHNALGLKKGEPIISVDTSRSIQYWVVKAAEDIQEETGNIDWEHVSAHDLRRTWATGLVQDGMPSEVVMDCGGWENHDTFKQHYWSPTDESIKKHLDRIGIY